VTALDLARVADAFVQRDPTGAGLLGAFALLILAGAWDAIRALLR
jgi:hypothetical protein